MLAASIIVGLFGFSFGWAIPTATMKEKDNHPSLCDPSIVQHSGYIEISQDVHYFYWFFESQNDPANAPLTVWLNGGPGCSSMVGLWQELGPCKLSDDGQSAASNPYSWNMHSNLLFFDQPAGAGFSRGHDEVNSTQAGAIPAYNFLVSFLKRYPKYSKAALHYFGESYAGHYVPVYADYIVQQNKLVQQGRLDNPIIHLESIGIGNGWTNALIQMEHYSTMACNSSYGSMLPKEVCHRMRNNYPACAHKVKKCYKTGRNGDCSAAESYCHTHVVSLFDQARRSYYDVRTYRDLESNYVDFLNSGSIKDEIGAKGSYSECSDIVYDHFFLTGDSVRNTDPYVSKLLNRGVRVLLYAGDADYICSWYGNYAWTEVLEFDGSDEYQDQSLEPWIVGDKEAGQIQSGGNLTFVRIYEAGHEVPYYQPKAALYMFNNHIQHTII